jgi:hypothetical protein
MNTFRSQGELNFNFDETLEAAKISPFGFREYDARWVICSSSMIVTNDPAKPVDNLEYSLDSGNIHISLLSAKIYCCVLNIKNKKINIFLNIFALL